MSPDPTARRTERPAWVVLDLGFGDAGKGATIDHLTRRLEADVVVRHHGGAQAGHNVVLPGGRHHCFSQIGSGSFVRGVRTLLADAFVLHPLALLIESEHLAREGIDDALARLTIDARARVITPYQQAEVHLRELGRGRSGHGTTGVGIDACVRDAAAGHDDCVVAGDLVDPDAVRARLERQQERKRAELAELRDLLTRKHVDLRVERAFGLLDDSTASKRIVEAWNSLRKVEIAPPGQVEQRIAEARQPLFEGAQGVMLDETWGLHPYVSWGDTTPASAHRLLGDRPAYVLGLTRTTTCRHGPGPLPGQDPNLDVLAEPHNSGSGWQGAFRHGALDLVLLRYAAQVVGHLDAVVINHMDQPRGAWPMVVGHRVKGGAVSTWDPGEADDIAGRAELARSLMRAKPEIQRGGPGELRHAVREAVSAEILIEGWGPTWKDRVWRG